MAKIVEETIVIKVSHIVKDKNAKETTLVTNDIVANLEAIVQELVGDGAVVEVDVA
jgi:hypothetical protein